MKHLRTAALALTLGVGACDGIGAHADTVATAGSRTLSVDRLGNLLGQSQAPIRKDIARSIAEVWVDYQLLAEAALKGDSLADPKVIDESMESVLQRARVEQLFQQVSAAWKDKPADTTGIEGRYTNGEFLAARHILIAVPQGSPPDSVSKFQAQASQLAKQVNAGNFASTAAKFSKDPGSAQRGGDLGVFPKGAMVPEFERGLLALKPGEISPPVRTAFGFHIIRRSTYGEVQADIVKAVSAKQMAAAESTYLAKIEADGKIDIKTDAALTAKAVAIDLEGHFGDNTVVASMKGGDFTAAKLAKLISTLPEKNQLISQIPNLPDSIIVGRFIKAVVRAELLSREADAKGIKNDTALVANVRRAFSNMVKGAWNGLGIAPAMLDSAAKGGDKAKVAGDRVEQFMDGLINQKVQFVEVPPPLEAALRLKYKASIDKAGIDRAIEKATKVRATADSAKAKSEPPSAVPVPGGAAAPAAPGAKKP
jgi:peptidyl-prolyl cis-trans isomerase D